MTKTEHQGKTKKFAGLTPLIAPVPPMLAKAMGYSGDARYVSFHWTPAGDEAYYSDGHSGGTGEWQGFLAYVHHPAVSPYLGEYDLGSSDNEAKHALILDREKLELFIAPVKEAEKFLMEQWPPPQPIRISQIEEQYKLVEELQLWLDKYLKN